MNWQKPHTKISDGKGLLAFTASMTSNGTQGKIMVKEIALGNKCPCV